MESIAVCITTRNRPEVFLKSFKKWYEFKPKNCVVFVVDDASDIDLIYGYTHRFETQQGIAKAKNKCLELAKDFDHIFLVDDDVYPKVHGWEKPYIESGVNHLCLTFDINSSGYYYSPSIRFKSEYNGLYSYTAPNGCFLYLTRKAIDTAGGMRPEFGIWGHEHVEYSQRIHLLGLTPHPFMDVPNSLELIHVCDYYNEVVSSIPNDQKRKSATENMKVWNALGGKAEFVSYI